MKMEKKVYTFESFVNDDTFSDVKFVCSDGIEVYGHKLILSQVSDFFSIMFRSGMREGISDRVVLTDARSYDTIILFQYAYGVDVQEKILGMEVIDALRLCRLASQFMMKELCEFIVYNVIHPNIDEQNCAEILNCSTTHSRVGDYDFWKFLQASALKYALDNLARLQGLNILHMEALNKLLANMSKCSLLRDDVMEFCESQFIPWAQKNFGVEGIDDICRVLAIFPPCFDEAGAAIFSKVLDLAETPNYSLKYVFNDSDGFQWFIDFSNSDVEGEKRACILIGPDEKLPTKTNHGWVTLAHFRAGAKSTRKNDSTAQLKTPVLSRLFTGDYRCQGHGCGAGCSFSHEKIISQCGIEPTESIEIQIQLAVNHMYGLICFYVFNSLSKNMSAAALLPFNHLKEVLQKDTLPVECEKYILDLILLWAVKHQSQEDSNNIKSMFEELIQHVRFDYIDTLHLKEVIQANPLLAQSPYLRKMEAKKKWAAQNGDQDSDLTCASPRVKYKHKYQRITSLTVQIQEKPNYKKCDLFTDLVSYYNDVEWDTEGMALSH